MGDWRRHLEPKREIWRPIHLKTREFLSKSRFSRFFVFMKPFFRISCLTAACLAAAFVPAFSSSVRAQNVQSALCINGECAPAISKTTFFARPAYKLTDGKTEAIIVPQIGRIMRFGKVGGPNLLWNAPTPQISGSGWKNYGGDKTWLAPQSFWKTFHGNDKWPPETVLDGEAHQAEVVSGGKLKMTSGISQTGIRIVRTLGFDSNGEFVIQQTAIKERGPVVRAGIWSISQLIPGEAVFLPLNRSSTYKAGIHVLGKVGAKQQIDVLQPNLARVVPAPDVTGGKWGVDAPVSSIVSVKNGVAFLQKSPKPAGQYPDGADGAGFPVELYINADPKVFYVELELLGPLQNFVAGSKSTHTVRWSLHDLPSQNVASPEVVGAVEKLLWDK